VSEEFVTFDDIKARAAQPFQTADGVELPDESPQTEEPAPDYSEIRIITGPKGQVRGSKVFINGQPIKRIKLFSVTGDLDQGHWETNLIQGVGGAADE
jgi:hypothetical protein